MIILFFDFLKNVLKYFFRKNFRTKNKLRQSLFFKRKSKIIKKLKIDSYCVDIIDINSFLCQFEEIFELETYSFKTNSSNPVIIDCGSNIGISIVYFKEKYPQSIIHSFEPDIDIFTVLKNNIQKNGFDNVILNQKAVWIKDEKKNFYRENNDSGHLSKICIPGKTNIVDCVSLAKYISNFSFIDFLKIDIEGSEYEVIIDLRSQLQKIKNLFIEFHSSTSDEYKLVEILDILCKNNFSFRIESAYRKMKPFNWDDSSSFNFQVNIFAKNNQLA